LLFRITTRICESADCSQKKYRCLMGAEQSAPAPRGGTGGHAAASRSDCDCDIGCCSRRNEVLFELTEKSVACLDKLGVEYRNQE
jgi:hypothetical protein